MNGKLRTIFSVFVVMFLVIVISGCTDDEGASNAEATVEGGRQTEKKLLKSQMHQMQDLQDFVLENTKMVKIFNISQRIHQKHPDLGPFQVVRGIDERGQKSEIWIKDMKIYEMISSESNQTTSNNSGEKVENTAPEEK